MLTKEQIKAPRYVEREIELLGDSVRIRILTGAERREWAEIVTRGEDTGNRVDRQQGIQSWLLTRTVCGEDDVVLFDNGELLTLPADVLDALFEESADANGLLLKRIIEAAGNSETSLIESSDSN